MDQSYQAAKQMLWAIFIVINITGVSIITGLNIFNLPARPCYGFEATIFFKFFIFIALALVGCRFFYDMKKLEQLCKRR